ncbi:hypothetical protein [Capnocytophaga sp.]|uniref:hypothetical protein n=1 Tax=Capnocytophaga sp. TaxID=44737 RepID=UPI0026DCDDC0|nr:hypothetical protein [Capnocytophaga sp.]MDO5104998.1 hypothetical protein [Capnocytophaga sp.]
MKRIIFIVILCHYFALGFAQTGNVQQFKWEGDISIGLGMADLKSEHFGISGSSANVSMAISRYFSDRIRLQLGLGASHFASGSLYGSGYSNVKATFLEIPLKMRFYVWKSEQFKNKIAFGIGVQGNKSVAYSWNNNGNTLKDNNGAWFFNMPLEVGVELPISLQNSLGIYLNAVYGNRASKNYVLNNQSILKLSLLYHF